MHNAVLLNRGDFYWLVCFRGVQTLLDTLRLALGKDGWFTALLAGSDSEERSSLGKVEGPD